MRNRVKFHSIYDLSVGFFLETIEKKLDKFDNTIEYDDINDILEFENIRYFIENNLFHKNLEEKKIEEYKNKIKTFPKILGKYFGKLKEEHIINELSKMEDTYIEDFWKLFSKHEVYKKISANKFNEILNFDDIYINYVLHYEKIVKYYDEIIKNYLLSHNNESVEFYLQEYFEEKEQNQSRLYFPLSLTKEEKEKQLELYVTEDFKKFNSFQLILKSFPNKELNLSPILKNKVKKIYDKLIEKNFNSNNTFTYGYTATFSLNQIKYKIVGKKNVDGKFIKENKYSVNWIKEHLDYPTLLNNFIYVFEFVDKFFRFKNVNHNYELGIFERFNSKSKNEYQIGIEFDLKRITAETDFRGYYKILKENNIRLEEVIEWFFKDYLLEEFGVKNFGINLPAENLTYLEKCKCITGEIEKAIKQFSMYREYKEIDNEVLRFYTEQTNFDDIKSLLNEKYIYANDKNNKIKNILFYLFSNQSNLTYIEKIEKTYSNFFQIILNEKIKKSMFQHYQLSIIDFLLKEEIIKENENGYLGFNKKLFIILSDLYRNEVLCTNYIKDFKEEIEFLKNKEMLCFEETLFSKKESDYLAYFLKSKYSNGLELRNKYAHGTHSLDENQHLLDYLKFLEILILIVIKINEEFCLYDKYKKNL